MVKITTEIPDQDEERSISIIDIRDTFKDNAEDIDQDQADEDGVDRFSQPVTWLWVLQDLVQALAYCHFYHATPRRIEMMFIHEYSRISELPDYGCNLPDAKAYNKLTIKTQGR